MGFFGNGDPEELLLFMQNFKKTLDTSGTLAANEKLYSLRILICVEALRQFDTFCAKVVITTKKHLNQYIWV